MLSAENVAVGLLELCSLARTEHLQIVPNENMTPFLAGIAIFFLNELPSTKCA